MKLGEASVGMRVIYTPFEGCKPEQKETGLITSITEKYIFVRYGNDTISKATRAKDLEPLGENR